MSGSGRRPPRARSSPVHGVWAVHKPVGPSSAMRFREVLADLERRAGGRLRACHGGTLDPFAEGLLLVLVGEWVHRFPAVHTLPKVYVADVAWGAETDTGDSGGRLVREAPRPRGDPDAALRPFLGWHEQVPPATSAKKIDGEPAYRRAHRGESVLLPPSRVYLHAARWLAHDGDRSRVALVCRGGFYVRSFVRDLARSVGAAAHVRALARPAIGPWSDPGGRGPRQVLPGREAADWRPPEGFPPLDPAWAAILAGGGCAAPSEPPPGV